MQAKRFNPILNVSSFAASISWFRKLGWEESWSWGNPPTFGGVRSGSCEIFLCEGGQGGRGKGENKTTFGPDDNSADKGVWMSVWVDDVDIEHRHCIANDIEITSPPANYPWGVRELHVRHPDGHVFRISQGLEEE